MYFCGVKRCTVLISALGLFASCSKSILPPAPVAAYSDIVRREVLPSMLALPVQVSVHYIEKQMNALLPAPIFTDNSFEDNDGDNLMLRVELRSPLKLTALGPTLSVKLPLKVWAKAGYRVEKFGLSMGKYEETNFELDAAFLCNLTLQPDYKLKTQTTPNGYTWIKKPTITLGGIEIPITAAVEKILDQQQATIAKMVDTQMGQYLDLKSDAEKVWRLVQEPMLINDEYKAWLTLTPKTLYAGPFNGQNNTITLPVGLAVQARSTLGAKPAPAPLPNLPPLTLQAPPKQGFGVNLLCQIPWAEARRLALKQITGQIFTFEGGRTLQITNLELYGQGKDMVIGASITGSLDGKVYLRGTPVFDPKTESVTLAGADFDIETSNKLAKAANWTMHGKLQRKMQPFLTFSIADQLKNGRDMIQKSLASNALRPDVKLAGTLDALAPGNIFVTTEGLEVDVTASGKVSLTIE